MKKRILNSRKLQCAVAAAAGICAILSGCATQDSAQIKPITNPFAGYSPATLENNPQDSMIFRSRRGDHSVEVEVPRATQGTTDFILPVSPSNGRSPASDIGVNNSDHYFEHPPTQTDHEITSRFPQSMSEDNSRREGIEHGLGLIPADSPTPEQERSYLGAVDHIKMLYRDGRFEAALIEVDGVLKDFPTDPRLYQMRGTLLDRLGQRQMALQSWNQALRFQPDNAALRKFIEKRAPAAVAAPAPNDGGRP